MDTLSRVADTRHFSSLPSSSSFSLFSFFSTIPGRSIRERERERERHELLFRDTPYYNGPPRAGEHRASRGEPLEDVFENARGLGFLSKLKTNSSHLCHRWHNNHLCLLLSRCPLFLLFRIGWVLFILLLPFQALFIIE